MKSIQESIANITKFMSVIVFLFTVVNFAQNDTFSEWDKDDNDELSVSEFQEKFSKEHFSDWDANNDDSLTSEEYYKSTFNILDEDGNKKLNTAEKDWGFEHLYGDYVNYDVEVVKGDNSEMNSDENSSKAVDYNKYRESVKETEFYSESDKDGNSTLSSAELSESVFNRLDKNDNGTLSSTEFNEFDRYYLDTENDS